MPRPPAGTTTTSPFVRSTARVPSAPPPWPTTLIAIVAIPRDASTDATTHGAPYMLSVNPCPKIATGQPPAGLPCRQEQLEVNIVRRLRHGPTGSGRRRGDEF